MVYSSPDAVKPLRSFFRKNTSFEEGLEVFRLVEETIQRVKGFMSVIRDTFTEDRVKRPYSPSLIIHGKRNDKLGHWWL